MNCNDLQNDSDVYGYKSSLPLNISKSLLIAPLGRNKEPKCDLMNASNKTTYPPSSRCYCSSLISSFHAQLEDNTSQNAISYDYDYFVAVYQLSIIMLDTW